MKNGGEMVPTTLLPQCFDQTCRIFKASGRTKSTKVRKYAGTVVARQTMNREDNDVREGSDPN
jgi:hypothetical protein